MNKRRVCIIGNSHAAALRAGLDLAPDLSEKFAFDFFAAQSDLMREMELRGETLVPTSELTKRRISQVSGGNAEIDTSGYMDFVIVGLGLNIVKIMDALHKYRLYGFHEGCNEVVPCISRACFLALVESIVRGSTAVYFARLLRSTSKARIVVIPQPYPSEEILKWGKPGFWKLAEENGLLAHVVQQYEEIARRVISDTSCEYLPQPASTLLSGRYTQSRFSHGSVRLAADMSIKHPPSEPYHMNGSFGVEVLKNYEGLLNR